MEKFKCGGKISLWLREIIDPWDVEGGQTLKATAPKLLLILHVFSWFSIMTKEPFTPSQALVGPSP